MVIKFFRDFDLLGPYEEFPEIAIAVSGGSDSLALVFIANEWVKSIGGKVVALTVDHRLRPESSEEAVKVGVILNQHNIEHHILMWQHEEIKSNIQEKARDARFDLLTNWCKQRNIFHLFLAQHKDDQAELLLMNLCRGSGLNGISGIKAENSYNQVRILRPFLNYSKQELRTVLKGFINFWVEDPSNNNLDYTRAKARQALKSQELLGLLNVADNQENILIDRVNLLISNLKRVKGYFDKQIAKQMAEIVSIYPDGYLYIDYIKFITLDEEIALHILASCLTTISVIHDKRPRLESLQRLYYRLKKGESIKATLWNCIVKLKLKDKLIEIKPEQVNGKYFLPLVGLT